jgi:hypothetical protein
MRQNRGEQVGAYINPGVIAASQRISVSSLGAGLQPRLDFSEPTQCRFDAAPYFGQSSPPSPLPNGGIAIDRIPRDWILPPARQGPASISSMRLLPANAQNSTK